MSSAHPQDFLDPAHRLGPDDTFRFACGPDVPCFTECCGKLELLLTPYDVLRLKQRLELLSDVFLDRHAIIRWATRTGFPEVMMRMDEGGQRRCPFVTPQGCSVYEDRPGACRIYPLGRASTKNPVDGKSREFFFTVREAHCRGFEQSRGWTVKEWLADQEISEYNRMNDLLMELFVLKAHRPAVKLHSKHMQMYMMACYNVERFRDFVFQSGFLRKFRLEGELVEQVRGSDFALLELSFRWLKFAFFQEPVLELDPAAR
ncbi:MAG: YkgJ family cysteine cluster protein [Thermodesulfobacteriota bacterium]